MKKVRFGLIGAGKMANRAHYPSLKQIDEAEMTALCDLVPAKAEETAERFGIQKVYSNYRQMLDENELDGVYCLMPPHHLFDIAMDVLSRGLHLFVEKPPGVTTFQAEALARQAEWHGCITLVGLNRQHGPMLRYAKERVEAKGPVTQVVATFYKSKSAAYYQGALSALHSDTIHCIDALRFMAGAEVESVHSVVSRFGDDVPNSWNAVMRFENGVAGVLLSHYGTGARIHRFEIHGEEIGVLFDPANGATIFEKESKAVAVNPKEIAPGEDVDGFLEQARTFVRCIAEGRQPRSTFADAAKTMRLCDQIAADSKGDRRT